jgi:tripartite-type tricarboxylate transporter receptor subunit TctC
MATFTSNCLAGGRLAAVSGLAFVAGLAASLGPLSAQTYPAKPIRVVISLSAGSATDLIPRIVLEHAAQTLGQSFIYENRVGAGGSIAANTVAKADPDGYTLLSHSNAHVISPSVMAKLPYDVINDFSGVTSLGIVPNVLVISAEQKINTFADFVKAGRSRAGGITFAAIVGSATHLNGEHFKKEMKVEGRMVPFKGAPEALTEVMAGRVDIYFSPILPALALIRDGKLKALAVSATRRVSALPDVPTGIEQGYQGSAFGLWIGLWAPAKTPRDVIGKLYAAIEKALGKPEVRERLAKMGVEPNPLTPEAFDKFTRSEVALNADLARLAGLKKQ